MHYLRGFKMVQPWRRAELAKLSTHCSISQQSYFGKISHKHISHTWNVYKFIHHDIVIVKGLNKTPIAVNSWCIGASSRNYGSGIQLNILKLLTKCFLHTNMERSQRYMNWPKSKGSDNLHGMLHFIYKEGHIYILLVLACVYTEEHP